MFIKETDSKIGCFGGFVTIASVHTHYLFKSETRAGSRTITLCICNLLLVKLICTETIFDVLLDELINN